MKEKENRTGWKGKVFLD